MLGHSSQAIRGYWWALIVQFELNVCSCTFLCIHVTKNVQSFPLLCVSMDKITGIALKAERYPGINWSYFKELHWKQPIQSDLYQKIAAVYKELVKSRLPPREKQTYDEEKEKQASAEIHTVIKKGHAGVEFNEDKDRVLRKCDYCNGDITGMNWGTGPFTCHYTCLPKIEEKDKFHEGDCDYCHFELKEPTKSTGPSLYHKDCYDKLSSYIIDQVVAGTSELIYHSCAMCKESMKLPLHRHGNELYHKECWEKTLVADL